MIRNDWITCKLCDCIHLASGGTPSKNNHAFWGGNIPWASCKDMKVDRLYDTEDHITVLGSVNGTKVIDPNVILIVVRGMILAKYFPIALTKKRMSFNQDLKAVFCKPPLNSEYLYYWLKANTYQILGTADEAAHGTKRIQTDRLLSMSIQIPLLSIQKKIVTILSTYDDLIENNTRRIAILEQMAQAIHREWFVEYRFPGHENTSMVESELGVIPEGWDSMKIGNVIQSTILAVFRQQGNETTHLVKHQRQIAAGASGAGDADARRGPVGDRTRC